MTVVRDMGKFRNERISVDSGAVFKRDTLILYETLFLNHVRGPKKKNGCTNATKRDLKSSQPLNLPAKTFRSESLGTSM